MGTPGSFAPVYRHILPLWDQLAGAALVTLLPKSKNTPLCDAQDIPTSLKADSNCFNITKWKMLIQIHNQTIELVHTLNSNVL